MEDQKTKALRESAEFAISLSDSLKRLEENEDFKKVFGFYFNNEAVRYTHLLGDSSIVEKYGEYQHVLNSLIGIAQCSAFFRNMHAIADMQRKTLEELDKEAKPVDAEVL